MIQTVKKRLYDVLSRNVATTGVRDTLVVAGAPRSGTTWLAEVLRELPGYKFLNEPLFLPNNADAQRADFDWRTHIPPRAENPTAERFFSAVLTGRIPHGPLWHYQASSSMGRIVEQWANRKLVVKFCRAGRLLHWLCRQFDMRGAVMIIRHPCAVIASQLEHGAWETDQLDRAVDNPEALGKIPKRLRNEFGTILEAINTRLELMTVVWCLDYYIPLIDHAQGNWPWYLTSYEELVLRGAQEMRRILSGLGAEVTEAIQRQLDEASGYASSDLVIENPEEQLSKWRERLSSEQVDRVLKIVRAFDLDFYTERVEPDYEVLAQYRNYTM